MPMMKQRRQRPVADFWNLSICMGHERGRSVSRPDVILQRCVHVCSRLCAPSGRFSCDIAARNHTPTRRPLPSLFSPPNRRRRRQPRESPILQHHRRPTDHRTRKQHCHEREIAMKMGRTLRSFVGRFESSSFRRRLPDINAIG
jgi:hypothetical protein